MIPGEPAPFAFQHSIPPTTFRLLENFDDVAFFKTEIRDVGTFVTAQSINPNADLRTIGLREL